jgi:hypothetical protein
VTILGIIDICYHLPDVFFALDRAGAPLYVLFKNDDIVSNSTASTMIYQYLREVSDPSRGRLLIEGSAG